MWGSEGLDQTAPTQVCRNQHFWSCLSSNLSFHVQAFVNQPVSLFDSVFGRSPVSSATSSSRNQESKPPIVTALPPLAFLEDIPSHQLAPPRQLMQRLMDLLLAPSTSSRRLEAPVGNMDVDVPVSDHDATATIDDGGMPDVSFLGETFRRLSFVGET